MFSNYLKTTFRNLLKNKFYSSLNIFGLTIGIACAGLIFLWVEDEINFDGFNTKKDRLYFARVNATLEAGVFTHWSSPGESGPAYRRRFPGLQIHAALRRAARSYCLRSGRYLFMPPVNMRRLLYLTCSRYLFWKEMLKPLSPNCTH